MIHYSLLNLLFLAPVIGLFVLYRPISNGRRFAIYVVGLIIATLVFDNLIVGTHIVAYTWQHTLGIKIGTMPVEDLAYTVAAVLLIPLLWSYYARKHR